MLIPEQILAIQNYLTKKVFRWPAMDGRRVCETAGTVKFATGTLCSINLGRRQTLHQRYNVNVRNLIITQGVLRITGTVLPLRNTGSLTHP